MRGTSRPSGQIDTPQWPSMEHTTLHASTCDHSKHRRLCNCPKASKKQPARYTCVDLCLVYINGTSKVSSPFRDATSTQNGQVTVNESMLLRSPQVTIIFSATNPSASVIPTAVVGHLQEGHHFQGRLVGETQAAGTKAKQRRPCAN